MKSWIKKNKKSVVIGAGVLSAALAAGAAAVCLTAAKKDESVYKETTVAYGSLTVGITEEGSVSVGTVIQEFDLDISEYSGSTQSSFQSGPMMPGGGLSASSSGRRLEVEAVYVSVGQQVAKGDPVLRLTQESIDDIREELAADEEDARLAYESLTVRQQKSAQEASHIYEQNRLYGETASMEYEETLYELRRAAEDAQEALTDAQEKLADLQEELQETQEDYEEALHYLKEATAAIESESDTYWYLKNEESREQAKKTAEDEEDKIERLEDEIVAKQQETVSLLKAYNEACIAYQTGEAEASAQYEKRMLNANRAGEIYGIATDQIAYEAKTAQEDYEDASEKLRAFDAYIVDGVVLAQYEGVVTSVGVEAGDLLQNDSEIMALNNYEDITMEVSVDDDDMKSVSVGDEVKVSFGAFPDGNFSGTVSDVGDATIDSNSDISYAVTISVDGDVSGLYGGMSGEATFLTKETKEAAYVSNRAVLREGTKSYVKLRDENGEIVKREIVTGFSDGSSVEIVEGLSEGDVVLIESKVKSE